MSRKTTVLNTIKSSILRDKRIQKMVLELKAETGEPRSFIEFVVLMYFVKNLYKEIDGNVRYETYELEVK